MRLKRGAIPRNSRLARYALVLPDSLADSPESVCHKCSRSEEVRSGAEAAGGQVALVLDGAVATGRWHILRHGEGVVRGVNGSRRVRELVVMLRSFAASRSGRRSWRLYKHYH